jgi:predicted DNA-binding protein
MMAQMIRKQVYIEPEQEAQLKQWAEAKGKTEAEIVREALDRWLEDEAQRQEAEAAWAEERTFIEARIAEGPVAGARTWTREELYEDRLNRYGSDAD